MMRTARCCAWSATPPAAAWETAGSNGAQVEFAADGQTLAGDIIVDTISTLTMTMKNGSTFTGTINIIDNAGAAPPSATTRSSRSRTAARGT